ncbi:MAG: metal ABC transporter permease [Chitinophagaceae bacterium]|nr:metal ABC transporter permease [Chitinophagaceae bacterium]
MESFYIILTGTLVSISCGLLGCYLVLRKVAMIGDAIAHSILPGIVGMYLLSGSRNPITMLIGAMLIGIFTTATIEFLQRKVHIQSDASIGVVFTSFFAVGIIMISLYANKVDLDQDCVLYGEISSVPLDVWITERGSNMGPRVLYILGAVALIVIGFIKISYRALFLTSFDVGFASSLGVKVSIWHYLLMGMVSFTTVTSFESVGSVLVVGFLIIPPSTAYLLTNSLKNMLYITCVIGLIDSAAGYYLAKFFNGSVSGAIMSVAGFLFLLVFIYTEIKKKKL